MRPICVGSHRSTPSILVLLLGASAMALGCIGNIGDRDAGQEGGPKSGEEGPPNGCIGCTESGITVVDSTRFPRLSHSQWENTIVALFDLDAPTGLSDSFAPDPLGGKAFVNNQAVLLVTPTLWSDYQSAAETIAAMVTDDAALLAKIAPADLPSDPAEKAKAFLESFGKRAFRRPLEPAEVDAYTALFGQAGTLYPTLDAFTGGARVVIEAFLQSPYFVYRPELGSGPDANGLVPLNDWEIASRLSYALWGSMPDEELFRAAEEKELTAEGGIEVQVDRMMDSPRARVVLGEFFDQLYEGDQYINLSKSPANYPDFDPALGADMRLELGKFVDNIVFEQEGGVRELLTSTTTFVTPGLAEIYGVEPEGTPDADGFTEATLDPAERTGLLTRLGFLAWKGTETQPDSILRGVFITRKIVCQSLGDPPDEAMGAMLGNEQTNREKIEALTGAGTCGATCHGTYINPAGFALEHYGAIGEFRTEDNGFPIDSSGEFPFSDGKKSYGDAQEFSTVLAESPQVHACFGGFWIEYLLGRDLVAEDNAMVKKLSEASHKGASTKDLVKQVLTSDLTRYRIATTEGE